jgi:hypothetical protein
MDGWMVKKMEDRAYIFLQAQNVHITGTKVYNGQHQNVSGHLLTHILNKQTGS